MANGFGNLLQLHNLLQLCDLLFVPRLRRQTILLQSRTLSLQRQTLLLLLRKVFFGETLPFLSLQLQT